MICADKFQHFALRHLLWDATILTNVYVNLVNTDLLNSLFEKHSRCNILPQDFAPLALETKVENPSKKWRF